MKVLLLWILSNIIKSKGNSVKESNLVITQIWQLVRFCHTCFLHFSFSFLLFKAHSRHHVILPLYNFYGAQKSPFPSLQDEQTTGDFPDRWWQLATQRPVSCTRKGNSKQGGENASKRILQPWNKTRIKEIAWKWKATAKGKLNRRAGRWTWRNPTESSKMVERWKMGEKGKLVGQPRWSSIPQIVGIPEREERK